MARNEQLIRQHKLLHILENSRFGKTLDELRDELVEFIGLSSLHTRTIRRDIEALQMSGYQVEAHDEQRGTVWKLGERSRKPIEITATATELVSLSLARDLMLPLFGTTFWNGIETFWNKVREKLPETVWKHYEEFREVIHVVGTPVKTYEEKKGMLGTLQRCVEQHRVAEIEYQPPGREPHTRKIEPYGEAFYQGGLYIICAAHDKPIDGDPESRIRHLKLDRFTRVTATDDYFKLPPKFNLEDYLEQKMGIFSGGVTTAYRVRLEPRAVSWVQEQPWSNTQTLEMAEDGSAVLTVKAGHDLEVVPKVLALGKFAEILEPASARALVLETVTDLAARYGEAAPPADGSA